MPNRSPKLDLFSVEGLKQIATIAAIVSSMLGFITWLLMPRITDFILQSTHDKYVEAREVEGLKSKLESLSVGNMEINTQVKELRESVIRQEANIKILVFLVKQKDLPDLDSSNKSAK